MKPQLLRSALPGLTLAWFSVIILSQAGPAQADNRNCIDVGTEEVSELFDIWNSALQTRDPEAVVALYRTDAILLPTLSNKVRLTKEARVDYFVHFLHDGPAGTVDQREIRLGCDMAIDAGLYTFTFADTGAVAHARFSFTYAYDDGQWLIASHHSSLLPEPN